MVGDGSATAENSFLVNPRFGSSLGGLGSGDAGWMSVLSISGTTTP
jgi:hypothetical protein